MKQLIQLIAVITLCVPQIHGQTTVLIDSLDWSFQSPGATSGQTDDGIFWQATSSNQDGTGTFGVSNNVFVFEDMEGSGPCPCEDGDPSPACGSLDNVLSIDTFTIFGYCEAIVKFDIIPRGDLKCGFADDQLPGDFQINGCPSDDGSQWAGTDGLEVTIFSKTTGELKVINFCGATTDYGSFTINESFDIGQEGGSLSISIKGGTQREGASYDIGPISIRGVARENLLLNPQIEGSPNSREVCEGEGSLTLIVAANPNHQYTWAYPDGTTVSGNVSNGRNKLRLENINPATSGTYRVTVVDNNGCELYDDIDITVLESIDAQCQAQVRFGELGPIQCSDIILPSMDDNGITGTWTPGAVLNDYAGQTLSFTFTPDAATVAPDNFLITVDDLSQFPNFGQVPAEIPLLCNAAGLTYDFIEMFNLQYVDYRLEVSGDLSLFNFVPNNAAAFVDEFVQDFRTIRVDGLSPRTVGFKVEAYTACGAPPLAKSFFVTIVDPADPITVDTTLCAGDSFMFGNHEIRGDTVIMGADACDTMFVANITRLQPVTSTRFYPGAGLTCGEAYYYYDTIIAGRHVGWIKGQLKDPPPHGDNYDTLFTDSFRGLYTLPLPASNGCDSIQQISLNVSGETIITEVRFDLCANTDTIIMSGSTPFKIDKDNPEMFVSLGNCQFLDIKANLIEAIADTIPQSTHCMGDIVTIEIAPGDFRDFDDSMIYPNTVVLDRGANGCAATVTVDLIFNDLAEGIDTRRICPGESFQVGSETFDAAVVDQEVIISGGAANGCDSTVIVNVTVMEPAIVPVSMTICPDETFTQEGEVFDINRPSGTVATLSSLGCDSIQYDVQLTFFEVVDTIIAPSICPGDEIFLEEYGFTIDEDNLTADLQGTTADGCNQNVLVRATIGGATRVTFSEEICFGDSYTFAGIDRVASGTYEERFTSPTGCDSISILELTVLRSIPVTADGEIFACTGLPSVHAGKEYFTSGRYRDTLTSVTGCDSIITFTITFTPPLTNDLGVVTICPGDTFTYENVEYTQRGEQEVMLQTPEGCDSMVTFDLQFFDIPMTDIGEVEICPEVPFIMLGNSYSDEGSYTAMTPGANGCDSLITFSIKHSAPIVTEVVETICSGESFQVFGVDYSATTDEMILDASSGQGGCDSTVHLVLTVLEEIITSESHAICEGTSVTVGDRTFTAAVEDEPVVLTSQASCDSTVLVTVTVLQNYNIDLGEIQLCGDDTFQVGDEVLSDEGPHTVNLTAQTGCDSIVTLSINRIQEIRTDISEVLCFGASAEVNNKIYDQAGVFYDTLTSSLGCDSILAIDISVLSKIDTNYLPLEIVCFGSSLDYNGDALSVTGDYPYDFTTQDGCDSIVVVRVEVAEEITEVVSASTCDDAPYVYEGQTFSVTGQYPITLQGTGGCDSIVTLDLTVNATAVIDLGEIKLCGDDTFQVGDEVLSDEGPHTVNLITQTGCDSIVTLSINRIEEITTDISEVICFGTSAEVNNVIYDQTGIFYDTLTSSELCDSILVIDITVLSKIDTNYLPLESVCFGESFNYSDDLLNATGDYVYDYTTANGCDSIVVVRVEVAEEITNVISASTCDDYVFEGQIFSQSGQYPVTLAGAGAGGCDSTVVLDLTVNTSVTTDLGDVSLCAGEGYQLGDTLLTSVGPHSITTIASTGCDSVITVTLIEISEVTTDISEVICFGSSIEVNNKTYDQAGIFYDTLTSSQMCDSILVIDITMLQEIATNFLPTETVCFGETYSYNNETLSTAGEHSYTFQTADGCDSTVVVTLEIAEEVTSLLEASTCDTYDFQGQSFSQTGQYEITLPGQAANGCDSTIMLDLTVNETYDIDLGVREICRGSSITMGAYVLDNDEIYTLLFTSASGCDSIVTVAVTVVEELNEDLGSVTICEGESYAFGGQNITESGSYSDTTTTEGNCINIRTIQVDVTPQMVINIQDLIGSCEGGANGSFVIGNLPDATPPFIVTGLDGISQISSLPFTVSGLAEGDYSFELTDANGCMTIGDAIITNEREDALTITSITVDPTGIYELILNYSGEIESIEWNDVEGLSCYDCPNPTVEITETTTFTVTVTDAEGCVSTAMITLEVDGVGMVYFPNVINPNSSVGNHRFYPQTEEGNDARYDVYIFDRWGNKVYEMRDGPVNDISFGWNGRYLNNRINSGVFVYSVRLYKPNGITKTYKGDLTVVE